MTGSKEDQLARAAKALAEAASLEADSMTQKELTAEKFDDKINTVNQNIDKLFSEVKKSNDILAEQLKLKRLELAQANTTLGSFEYWAPQSQYNASLKKSSELAKSIIGWFILGYGYTLPDAYVETSNYNTTRDEAKKTFRDKIVKQIKELIGKEPRVNGDTIYYE